MRMLGRWESDGSLMVLVLVHSLNATRNNNGRREGNGQFPSIQLEKESMRLTAYDDDLFPVHCHIWFTEMTECCYRCY